MNRCPYDHCFQKHTHCKEYNLGTDVISYIVHIGFFYKKKHLILFPSRLFSSYPWLDAVKTLYLYIYCILKQSYNRHDLNIYFQELRRNRV